jgi:hypothetical protein
LSCVLCFVLFYLKLFFSSGYNSKSTILAVIGIRRIRGIRGIRGIGIRGIGIRGIRRRGIRMGGIRRRGHRGMIAGARGGWVGMNR